VVVKPLASGSSIGVAIATRESELIQALEDCIPLGGNVVLEQYIKGREIQVGYLVDRALPSIEIIPKSGFYDYKNKYQAGLTTHICPADLGEEATKKAGEITLQIFNLLRMNAYGRIDMIYVEEKGEFWFIEANNLPGMTNTSLLPEAAKADGIAYEDLCEKIVMSAGRDEIEGL
jgi:D-alanine-D-alanine ligase